MSKTNVFTLVATILLGVLLYTISRFTDSLPQPPPAVSIREAADQKPPSVQPTGALANSSNYPRLSTNEELLAFLHERGIDGQNAIEISAAWFQARGFSGVNAMLGVTADSAPENFYQSMDDESLRKLAAADNSGASQALAARILFTDPFAALDLYRRAAAQGSVYAILQIGALLESLTDMSLDVFESEPDYLRKLGDLRNGDMKQNPNLPALIHALAAARDGGLAIIDTEMLKWIQRLTSDLSELERQSACERSSRLFLEIGVHRRQRGLQPISTEPPPVFFSVPELEKRLPCQTSGYPIVQLLDLERCSQTLITDHRGQPMQLNICKN